MILRNIQKNVEASFFKGKAVIIHGARQVGKTTLIKKIQQQYMKESMFINCDEPDLRTSLTNVTSSELGEIIGNKKIVFIDEAQRVKNIGLTLKLFVDNFPNRQVVATGSSSIELSNEIVEPLTGRKYEFHLFPFSISELREKYSNVELARILEKRMILGMYPEIVTKPDEAQMLLKSLSSSYLYKDVLQYQDIRKPELLEKLLTALALQVGNEVSYNELGNLLGVNKQTVAHYIQLLEKTFVIFRLSPFSRNLRTELSKLRKIYFFDTGIRNAVINNFNPLRMRQDVGQIWENFMISERIKRNSNIQRAVNCYFWRTHQQQEIDYLEEIKGELSAFEIKWTQGKCRVPRKFLAAYPESEFKLITRENYHEFLEL